jgi:hypothetical protein
MEENDNNAITSNVTSDYQDPDKMTNEIINEINATPSGESPGISIQGSHPPNGCHELSFNYGVW